MMDALAQMNNDKEQKIRLLEAQIEGMRGDSRDLSYHNEKLSKQLQDL